MRGIAAVGRIKTGETDNENKTFLIVYSIIDIDTYRNTRAKTKQRHRHRRTLKNIHKLYLFVEKKKEKQKFISSPPEFNENPPFPRKEILQIET